MPTLGLGLAAASTAGLAHIVRRSQQAKDRVEDALVEGLGGGWAFESASPILRINGDEPDFFVIHGAGDTLVDVGQARTFVERLRRFSKNSVATPSSTSSETSPLSPAER